MSGKYYDNEKFEKLGYAIIDSGLTKKDLNNAQNAYQEILKKSRQGDYKYVRVYDDCIGALNLSAIEMPFHPYIIDKRIVNILNNTNIINIAKERLGENIKLTLSRYHITGDISHIGMWHRDGDIGTKKDLLISLFLYDEQGFELIEGSHDKKLLEDKEIINNKTFDHSSLTGTTHASVKSGEMIIFNPAIIHRGISENPRANIHFRFEVDPNYEVSKEYQNEYGFNEEWQSVLSNKNSIIVNPSIPEFKSDNTVKGILRKCIKTFVHYGVFFLPLNSLVYKKAGIYPSLKLRRLFGIAYQA